MPKRLLQAQSIHRGFWAGLTAGVVATVPVSAQTALELASLRVTVEAYNANFDAGDFSAMLTSMPPHMVKGIAAEAGVSPDEFREIMDLQLSSVLTHMNIETFEMDAASATWGETATGLTYAMVPTETVFSVPERGSTRSTTTMLALQEDGHWYLMRMETAQQLDQLRDFYPEFRDVTFPTERLEIID